VINVQISIKSDKYATELLPQLNDIHLPAAVMGGVDAKLVAVLVPAGMEVTAPVACEFKIKRDCKIYPSHGA
jgi:hypothetical protein